MSASILFLEKHGSIEDESWTGDWAALGRHWLAVRNDRGHVVWKVKTCAHALAWWRHGVKWSMAARSWARDLLVSSRLEQRWWRPHHRIPVRYRGARTAHRSACGFGIWKFAVGRRTSWTTSKIEEVDLVLTEKRLTQLSTLCFFYICDLSVFV